jgi:integrase/recombinase XerD
MDLEFVVKVATSADLEAVLKRYATNLKTKVAPSTQEKYTYHMKCLRLWLAERGVYEPGAITRQHLEEWVSELHDEWGKATIKQAVAAARNFFRWLEEVDLLSKKQRKKLFKALPLPKVEKNEQRTLSLGEIQALLAVCDPSRATGSRNLPLIELLVASGLRAAEIRRLQVSDLEFGVRLAPEVVVNRLTVVIKGNKRRAGYFDERTAEHLRAWLAVRARIAAPGVPEVFVSIGGTTRGRALSRDGLKVILRKLGQEAGVKGVSPHPFRRAFACLLQMAGANVRTIQELGRWDDPDMPLLYTRAFEAALVYNQFAPMDFIRSARES